MIIGFTGTQRGMTQKQFRVVMTILTRFGAFKVRHGDCVGADAQFDGIARALNLNIVVHPPTDPKKRAHVPSDGKTTYLTPKPYKTRNQNIVDMCDLLIAAPYRPEYLRSGTWSTIRYARKQRRQIIIVEP